MEIDQIINKRGSHSLLLCYVCGDVARGMNFDVITCMSCKAFFRRHALRPADVFRCLLDGSCDITKLTRGSCSACRLKRCFALGMNPQLIRSPYKIPIKQQKINFLPKPKPISLLRHDRSTLTFIEWNLLSNILHAYDGEELTVRTQSCLKEQLSLPPKLRSKTVSTLELVGSFYTAVQPIMERSPYFHALPADMRKIIIQNNFTGIGSFNTVIAAAEANVFDNESHVLKCCEIYGPDYMKGIYRLMTRVETNRALLKILLMILAFSSNCSIVTFDCSSKFMNVSTSYTCYMQRVQDIFVTMLWKYLVYQYGYQGAVVHLDHMIKNYLDTLNSMHANASTQHWNMVDVIVEKTAHSLTIDD